MFTIQLARPSDVGRFAAIELAAARLLIGHAPESILTESTHPDALHAAQAQGRLWVALEEDVPVGFAIVEMLADGMPHLNEIDVHPDHGRRGIGAALVRTICAWAVKGGYEELTLTTFRSVPWNMPFYSRMGFEEIPPAELSPELLEVIRDETARGLDPAARVAMRYRCP
ncbi:MAG TPA: GNAT family N-acetyltransferase [Candidatus Limnocylindrales bacterium]|nr:GNAT family N-acetyltransferase [Candidatus Limnocylindrales bacterium]